MLEYIFNKIMPHDQGKQVKSSKNSPGLYKFSPYKWKEEIQYDPSADLPKARSGHRVIFYNGSIYAFGGFNPVPDDDEDHDPDWIASKPLFKELWQFNIFSRKWKKIDLQGPTPRQLASHTATLVHLKGERPKMMVYGGTGTPYGVITSHSVFMLDLHTFEWEIVPATGFPNAKNCLSPEEQLPQPLYGQAVVLDKSSEDFYTIGGTSGHSYYIDVHKMNLRKKQWEWVYITGRDRQSEFEPTPRYRHELAFYKDKIFVLGGGTALESDGFDYIHAFDIKFKTWDLVRTHPDPTIPISDGLDEQFPSPRRCHGLAQHQNFVFLIGGYDGIDIFNQTWRLNLDTMEWRRLPYNLPQPVYFSGTTITPAGKIYNFGGVTSVEKNTRSNSLFSCWSTIPSLRDMCWEAVNHYCGDLVNKPVKQMIQEGIPSDLLASFGHSNLV